MNNPKFKIGDKVVIKQSPTIPQSNSVFVLGSVSALTYLSNQWSYVIRAEKGYAYDNDGICVREWSYENHNTVATETELELIP